MRRVLFLWYFFVALFSATIADCHGITELSLKERREKKEENSRGDLFQFPRRLFRERTRIYTLHSSNGQRIEVPRILYIPVDYEQDRSLGILGTIKRGESETFAGLHRLTEDLYRFGHGKSFFEELSSTKLSLRGTIHSYFKWKLIHTFKKGAHLSLSTAEELVKTLYFKELARTVGASKRKKSSLPTQEGRSIETNLITIELPKTKKAKNAMAPLTQYEQKIILAGTLARLKHNHPNIKKVLLKSVTDRLLLKRELRRMKCQTDALTILGNPEIADTISLMNFILAERAHHANKHLNTRTRETWLIKNLMQEENSLWAIE